MSLPPLIPIESIGALRSKAASKLIVAEHEMLEAQARLDELKEVVQQHRGSLLALDQVMNLPPYKEPSEPAT